MTENIFIRAAEDADPEFKNMVSAANNVIAAYFSAAEKHELCANCFAQFMMRVFTDLSKVAPHSDDDVGKGNVGKGNVDQVGNA